MKEIVIRELRESASLKQTMAESLSEVIVEASRKILNSFKSGGKVLLAGNGGSAADAQHIAAELVGRYQTERAALPAIALSADSLVLTALANDYGYDTVFSRQIEALGGNSDALVVITTSGTSPNILKAARAAHSKGMTVIGLTGNDGGKLKDIADIIIIVPSNSTPRIQEAHITIGHIICRLVEEGLKDESGGIS